MGEFSRLICWRAYDNWLAGDQMTIPAERNWLDDDGAVWNKRFTIR